MKTKSFLSKIASLVIVIAFVISGNVYPAQDSLRIPLNGAKRFNQFKEKELASNELDRMNRRSFMEMAAAAAMGLLAGGLVSTATGRPQDMILDGDRTFGIEVKSRGIVTVKPGKDGHVLTYTYDENHNDVVFLNFEKPQDLAGKVIKIGVRGVKGSRRIPVTGVTLIDKRGFDDRPVHAWVNLSKNGIKTIDLLPLSTIDKGKFIDIHNVTGIALQIDGPSIRNPINGEICIEKMWIDSEPQRSRTTISLDGFEQILNYGTYHKENCNINVSLNDILVIEMNGIPGRDIGIMIKEQNGFWLHYEPIRLQYAHDILRIPISLFTSTNITKITGMDIVVGPALGTKTLEGAKKNNTYNLNHNWPVKIQVIHVPLVSGTNLKTIRGGV